MHSSLPLILHQGAERQSVCSSYIKNIVVNTRFTYSSCPDISMTIVLLSPNIFMLGIDSPLSKSF